MLTDLYSAIVDETRLFIKAFENALAFTYRDTKQRLGTTRRILTGQAEPTENICQMKDCGRHSVGLFPQQNTWKDDLFVCRRHWVLLHTTIRLLIGLALVAVIGGPLALMVMFA